MRPIHFAGFLSLLAFSTLASPAALADTTYTYTSSPFTSVSGPYTTTESVLFSFTVAKPLKDNLANKSIFPTSYTISDGVATIGTGITGSNIGMSLTTNSAGAITNWNILAQLPHFGDSSFSSSDIQIVDQGETAETDSFGTFSIAQTQLDHGTWRSTDPNYPSSNLAPTPEPSSLILLGTGALGLLGAARHRFRRT